LGYDWSCESNIGCSHKYYSFNKPDSPELTKKLSKMIDYENILN